MRPKLSFQTRIFGACILVVLCTLAFVATVLQRSLKEQMITQSRETIQQEMDLLREILVPQWPPGPDIGATDGLADQIGERLRGKVTFIDTGGRIIGDSDLTPEQIAQTSNQSSQLEFSQALNTGVGWSFRYNATKGANILYMAESLGPPDNPRLIIRLARPLTDLDKNLSQANRYILWASVLGVLLSLGVAYVVAHQIFSPVRDLTRTALDISSGDLTQRLRRYPNDELGDLSRAFDRMADHLQDEIEAVTRGRDRLEAVLRSMVEGVMVTDASGRITLVNRAFRELVDLGAYPVGGRPSEIIRNADLIEAIHQVAEGAPYANLEIRTLGGSPRTLEVEIAALPGGGPRAGIVAVFHDITERKRLDEMRRDFVANVSHELRTPLAAIKGAAETLLGGALNDPKFALKFSEVIDRHATRLESIVLDLLELAKLESVEKPPPSGRVPVHTLIETSIAAVADLAEARQVELVHDIPEEKIYIYGNNRQLEQALVNLLENAVKYTDSGGRVRLGLVKEENHLKFEVSDTGIGIAPEHLPRIFERFYRADKNRSREMGGTGLGLAIVKHVAQVHGGHVEVRSSVRRGTTFSLVLPQNQ